MRQRDIVQDPAALEFKRLRGLRNKHTIHYAGTNFDNLPLWSVKDAAGKTVGIHNSEASARIDAMLYDNPLSYDERAANAKRWGKAHGYRGEQGGWIYNSNSKAICQGWCSFFERFRRRIIDDVRTCEFKLTRSR